MTVPVAIVVGAAMIAASIAFTSHWSVQPVSGRVGTLRLNNWAGEVAWCAFTITAAPSDLDCRPDEWVSVMPKQ
jgi:hypothetical protein